MNAGLSWPAIAGGDTGKSPMADTISTKLLILGGGPGGYVAGIRAGQLGIDTVLVEAAGWAAPA